MLSPGQSAPEFTLKDLAGQPASLSQITASKPALITFLKISCPVCQLALPFIDRMSKSARLEMVAVSQDGPEATQEFNEAFGVTFRTVLDEAGQGYPVSNAFGITHVPSMFVVEPGGAITMAVAGFSRQDLEAIGKRAGVSPFREGDEVPDWKPG
jgi:peroxiredoxin